MGAVDSNTDDEDSDVGDNIGAFLDDFGSSESDSDEIIEVPQAAETSVSSQATGSLEEVKEAQQAWQSIPCEMWGHEACLGFLRALPTIGSVTVDVDRLVRILNDEMRAFGVEEDASLSGTLLLHACHSTRELKDIFGLVRMADRLAFDKALQAQTKARREHEERYQSKDQDQDNSVISIGLKERVQGSNGGIYR